MIEKNGILILVVICVPHYTIYRICKCVYGNVYTFCAGECEWVTVYQAHWTFDVTWKHTQILELFIKLYNPSNCCSYFFFIMRWFIFFRFHDKNEIAYTLLTAKSVWQTLVCYRYKRQVVCFIDETTRTSNRKKIVNSCWLCHSTIILLD